MEPALLIVLFGLFALAAFLVSRHLKLKRRQELARVAGRLGLGYSPEDHLGLVSLPFALFSRGDGRGTENLVWGTWQGLGVKEIDYWYYEESTDHEGRRSRTYHRFSCALTEITAACPHLAIARETFLTRLADHAGFRDIEFESEEFNRAFNVKAADPKFASDVVDPRMMQWLLYAGPDFGYEIAGPFVLSYTRRLRPHEIERLLGCLKGFLEHIPRVVWDLYPAR